MPKNSDGLMLVWNLAAMEANHARLPRIEPGQLLVALCKVGDVPLADTLREDTTGRLRRLKLEVAQIEELFAGVKLDVRRFRRRLRAELGRGTTTKQKIVHRSEATLQVFEAAESFCASHNLSVVRPVHLLIALCEQGEWHPLLRECGANPAQLHGAALAAGERELPKHQAALSSTPTLDKYGRDLSALSRSGQMAPLVEVLRGIGQIIYFQPLEPEAVREIIDKIVDAYRVPLLERGLTLTLEPGAYDFLMKRGYNGIFGAREMERTVERLLTEPLSRLIVQGDCSPGTTLRARVENESIMFQLV